MSRENVEVVRAATAAWNSEGLEGVLAFCPGDVILYPFSEAPESQAGFRGHDGVREVMGTWLSSFDHYVIEPHEWRDLGDRVLMLGEMSGVIKGSAIEVRQPIASLSWDFRDGQVGRARWFSSWEEALEAAEPEE
jgi:hypothetical protein